MRYALADAMIYVSHNRAHHNVGTCLWHVSVANHHCFKALETYRRREHCPQKNNGECCTMHQRIGNMPKACPYAMALSF